jgi:hypothetical protein
MSHRFRSILFERPERKPDSFVIMLARFPQKRSEDPACTDWLMQRAIEWEQDPRIHAVFLWSKDDTPITMSRNAAIEAARECGADFILMLDSDMQPDKELIEGDPTAKPFWSTSWDFAYERRMKGEPCVIAAPYCGPPPVENIYVFQWATEESESVDRLNNFFLAQYGRDQAADMKGIVEAAALATGLIIIDMEGMKTLEPPYFYYEYADERESKKASTEDVTFTRDLSIIGVQQYCNWDSWAGHVKFKIVGKPRPIGAGWVRGKILNALNEKHFGVKADEQIVMQKRNSLLPHFDDDGKLIGKNPNETNGNGHGQHCFERASERPTSVA